MQLLIFLLTSLFKKIGDLMAGASGAGHLNPEKRQRSPESFPKEGYFVSIRLRDFYHSIPYTIKKFRVNSDRRIKWHA
ncbi:hypothetical protein [Paenibacillus sp. RC21]|uniref:hypothetical protein n=1 Tax=Paenibacillus sp. RC21 TaxID=3156312 RepID=UPI003834D50D